MRQLHIGGTMKLKAHTEESRVEDSEVKVTGGLVVVTMSSTVLWTVSVSVVTAAWVAMKDS